MHDQSKSKNDAQRSSPEGGGGISAKFLFDDLDGQLLAAMADEAKHLTAQQGKKIRTARNKSGMTIDDLAHVTGMHFNTIGRIERGDSEASLLQLMTIARALKANLAELQPFDQQQPGGAINEDEFAIVDVLDVHVSAGPGALNGDNQAIAKFAFQRKWLKQIGVNPANAKVIRARGDSMADKINDSDVLLVDTSVKQIERDGVYVIELDGLDYVKLLQRDFATGGVQIISYNPDYKPQLLSAEQAAELRISGRVVWHGGEL